MEAYFDESYGDDSPFLVVAGYLFESQNLVEMDREWRKVLEKYQLPYFHMCDCAHGNDIYKQLSMSKRIATQTEAMELVKKYATLGIAVSVEEPHYRPLNNSPLMQTAYSFACLQCLIGVQEWADENNYQGEIAYFFEAGHKHQTESNRFMELVFKEPPLCKMFRYARHSFVPKSKGAPIQAADILAWQWYTQTKKVIANLPVRADLKSLFEKPIHTAHFDKGKLSQLATIERNRYALENLKASLIPNYKPFLDNVRLRYL